MGDPDAEAELDIWTDYSCTHCKDFEEQFGTTIGSLAVQGKLVVNYHQLQVVSDYGANAGAVSACVAAADPSSWPDINSVLYALQGDEYADRWTPAQFATFLGEQGVNEAAQTCATDRTYRTWVTANTADARKQGITSTPTVFLNDTRVQFGDVSQLEQAVEDVQ